MSCDGCEFWKVIRGYDKCILFPPVPILVEFPRSDRDAHIPKGMMHIDYVYPTTSAGCGQYKIKGKG